MRRQVEDTLQELCLQLELDEERGAAPLAVRARALRAASAAGDRAAERQALIDLAAACLSCASRLPAPRIALAELEPRTGGNRRAGGASNGARRTAYSCR